MTEDREEVGLCEGCAKMVYDDEPHHTDIEMCITCAECSPMLSDAISQHREAIDQGDWDLLNYETEADAVRALEIMENAIAKNGDRSLAL